LTADTTSDGDTNPSNGKLSTVNTSTPAQRAQYSMRYSPKRNPDSSSSHLASSFSTAHTITIPSSNDIASKLSSSALAKPDVSKSADLEQNGATMYDNALADLEEWLLSGSVIITD
jgi:hypothetical protein